MLFDLLVAKVLEPHSFHLTDTQIEFPPMSRIEIRTKKEFDETKLNLSVYNGRLKKVSMIEAELPID